MSPTRISERKERSSVRGDVNARRALAVAVMAAVEPLLEVLLRIGITSPEAEGLMRGLYVHRAREWLASQATGRLPSDVRVALVTGVHRNFVRQILATSPAIPSKRERRAYLSGRVLRAWRSDARYCDESGKARDIPEVGQVPSFAALVGQYLPRRTPSVVLEELLRAGAVQKVAGDRVRLRRRAGDGVGLHPGAVSAYGKQAQALLRTLTVRLLDSQAEVYADTTPSLSVASDRLPRLRHLISQRADAFLAGLEQELSLEHKKARGKKVPLSVAVMQLEGKPSGRNRRRHERPCS